MLNFTKKELKNSRVIFIDQKSKIALKPENVQLANHNFFGNPNTSQVLLQIFSKMICRKIGS